MTRMAAARTPTGWPPPAFPALTPLIFALGTLVYLLSLALALCRIDLRRYPLTLVRRATHYL